MVIENRSNTKVQFSSLSNGDVFIYDDIIYIKVQEDEDLNAVSLENGALNCFFQTSFVQRVNAKLVIE